MGGTGVPGREGRTEDEPLGRGWGENAGVHQESPQSSSRPGCGGRSRGGQGTVRTTGQTMKTQNRNKYEKGKQPFQEKKKITSKAQGLKRTEVKSWMAPRKQGRPRASEPPCRPGKGSGAAKSHVHHRQTVQEEQRWRHGRGARDGRPPSGPLEGWGLRLTGRCKKRELQTSVSPANVPHKRSAIKSENM